MITHDSTEKQIKDIHESTLRLKTSQPFFYGQLNMKQSVSDGNYYVTIGSSSMRMKVTFTANTQDNPFCMFYVTAGIGGNFERHDVLSIKPDATASRWCLVGKLYRVISICHTLGAFIMLVYKLEPMQSHQIMEQ